MTGLLKLLTDDPGDESPALEIVGLLAVPGSQAMVINSDNSCGGYMSSRDAVRGAAAYAIRISRNGHFFAISFDFDASKVDAEQAKKDADDAESLFRRMGIGAVLCKSGPTGGWHVHARFEKPMPAMRVKALAQIFARRWPTLDIGPLCQPRQAHIRPPFSPHRSGNGRSMPDVSLAEGARLLREKPLTREMMDELFDLLLEKGSNICPLPGCTAWGTKAIEAEIERIKTYGADSSGEKQLFGLCTRIGEIVAGGRDLNEDIVKQLLLGAITGQGFDQRKATKLVRDGFAAGINRPRQSMGRRLVANNETHEWETLISNVPWGRKRTGYAVAEAVRDFMVSGGNLIPNRVISARDLANKAYGIDPRRANLRLKELASIPLLEVVDGEIERIETTGGFLALSARCYRAVMPEVLPDWAEVKNPIQLEVDDEETADDRILAARALEGKLAIAKVLEKNGPLTIQQIIKYNRRTPSTVRRYLLDWYQVGKVVKLPPTPGERGARWTLANGVDVHGMSSESADRNELNSKKFNSEVRVAMERIKQSIRLGGVDNASVFIGIALKSLSG